MHVTDWTDWAPLTCREKDAQGPNERGKINSISRPLSPAPMSARPASPLRRAQRSFLLSLEQPSRRPSPLAPIPSNSQPPTTPPSHTHTHSPPVPSSRAIHPRIRLPPKQTPHCPAKLTLVPSLKNQQPCAVMPPAPALTDRHTDTSALPRLVSPCICFAR